MLDRFDLQLLSLVQRDDSRTADSLAADVPLSPSAIARRLRRLRADGWIARTLALLSKRLTELRLRALVFIELAEHADLKGKERLEERLRAADEVQFCYETTGGADQSRPAKTIRARPGAGPRVRQASLFAARL